MQIFKHLHDFTVPPPHWGRILLRQWNEMNTFELINSYLTGTNLERDQGHIRD